MNSLNRFITQLNWKKLFLLTLFIWVSFNVIQSVFMEIMSDEAYYSLYGENLAWGYFDHPPMVGFITWFSSLIFKGNLSVRFMTIVLNLFTIVLIWKLTGEKEPTPQKVLLFFAIAASMVMLTAYGFITAPDVPFLFFAALFLFAYKRFLQKESWFDTFLLGVAMAGMIYSKYHAALVIGFIVLSNLKLLTRYKAWLAVLIAAILLIPHLKWQMDMDFLSINYHMGVRSRRFKWSYFFEYLPNQLGVFNPLALGAIVYVVVKRRAADVFERGLYFLMIGFFFFFWAMTFRGHVGPHWTVAATIPMIVMLYRHSLNDEKLKRFIKRWLAPTIILLIIARIILISGLLPERLGFSGKREKHEATHTIAGDLPVAYVSSFQKPSNYHFFIRKDAFTLNAAGTRQTQFDVWQKELNYHGKPVFIFQDLRGNEFMSLPTQLYEVNGYAFRGYFTQNFQTVNRVKVDYSLPLTEMAPGDTLVFDVEIHNPTDHDIDFRHSEFPVSFSAVYITEIYKGKTLCCDAVLNEEIGILKAHSTITRKLTTVAPDIESKEYPFLVSLYNKICYAQNSPRQMVKIK